MAVVAPWFCALLLQHVWLLLHHSEQQVTELHRALNKLGVKHIYETKDQFDKRLRYGQERCKAMRHPPWMCKQTRKRRFKPFIHIKHYPLTPVQLRQLGCQSYK